MRENLLKRKLEKGEVVVGPFMVCPSTSLVEIVALAGFDLVIIDMEHGPLSTETAQTLCSVAQGVGITPIVRVRKNDGPQIQRALDIASGGVQVPQIECGADAEAVVRAAKYQPLGMRGMSLYTRAGDYTVFGTKGYTDRLNAEQLVVIHVEGRAGLEHIDEIVAVPYIDVVFLGPYDLSQSFGIPGQVNDPRVVQGMEEAAAKIRAAGKAVGTFADNVPAARRWIDVGVQYISLGVDVGIFAKACNELVRGVRD
jgi:4-hydroxy-2-oxoheptanedioate aldolase